MVQSTGVQLEELEKACMSLSESHTDSKRKRKRCGYTRVPREWSTSVGVKNPKTVAFKREEQFERTCLWIPTASVKLIYTSTSAEEKLELQLWGMCMCMCVHYVWRVFFFQQVVARDWCIGGWKQRTCSTVELSVSTAFMYLFRMAKISLLRIWYFLMRSAIFFRGYWQKQRRISVLK